MCKDLEEKYEQLKKREVQDNMEKQSHQSVTDVEQSISTVELFPSPKFLEVRLKEKIHT